jgi:HEAT repeat protein
VKVEVVQALAMRHVTAATPALLKAAEDTDAGVRNESFKSLGAVATTDSLAAVSALLAKTQDDGSRGEAAKALVNIARRDADTEKRAEPILAAETTATGPAKFSLMGVLGLIGGQKSLEAVRAAVKDNDEKTKDAAIRALADWPDAAAAADLLDVAKTAADEPHQVLAIRGSIRVVRLPSGRPGPENAKMLIAGLETAKRPEEKKQALGGLAEVRELAALQAVVPCLDDPALKEEAAQAAVRIGRDIWNNDKNAETVKTAMEKVIEVSKNQDMVKQAKETLGNAEKKAKAAAEKK